MTDEGEFHYVLPDAHVASSIFRAQQRLLTWRGRGGCVNKWDENLKCRQIPLK